jgi:nitrogen-specific signal transduction histidine kinase
MNPCISFGASGEVKYINSAAEVLFAYANQKDIFDIAVLYAPKSYGYKTIFTQIRFQKLYFFAISVGYDSDEEITIRLYYEFAERKNSDNSRKNFQKTNIYQIIEASINSIKIDNDIEFMFIFDTSLPTILMNQNNFATIISAIFRQNNLPKHITLSLKIKIGEFIKVESERYQVIELRMNIPNTKKDSSIDKIAKKSNIILYHNKIDVVLDIPLIEK